MAATRMRRVLLLEHFIQSDQRFRNFLKIFRVNCQLKCSINSFVDSGFFRPKLRIINIACKLFTSDLQSTAGYFEEKKLSKIPDFMSRNDIHIQF